MSTLQHQDAISQAENFANRVSQLKALFIALERLAHGAQNYGTCPDFELQMIRQLADLGTDNADRLYSVMAGLQDIIKFDLVPVADVGAVAGQATEPAGQDAGPTIAPAEPVVIQKRSVKERQETIEKLRLSVDDRQLQVHAVLCSLDAILESDNKRIDTLALAAAGVYLSEQMLSEYGELYMLIGKGGEA